MPVKRREKIGRIKDAVTPSLDALGRRAKTAGRVTTEQVSQWFNTVLATDFVTQMDGRMRRAFTSKATIYDQAMDAKYHKDHIGGGDHRLFDDGHDLFGAWQAVSNANPDDTLLHEVGAYFTALWKDLVTPHGLPLMTFDHDHFQQVAQSLHDSLGVSTDWLKDMASYTATELIGASTGTLAVVLNWNADDVTRFSSLIGSFGLSSVVGGNPFLLLLAVIALARAYQTARPKEAYGSVARGMLKGGIGTGSFLAVSAMCTPHVWVGLMFGVCAGVMARKAFDRGSEALSDVNWSEIASFIYGFLKVNVGRPNASTPPIGFLPVLPLSSMPGR